MPISPQISESIGIEKTPKAFTVGTLQYTVGGLFALFTWLLWGDFAFYFFESIFGRFIPLYLKEYQASNTLIGIMMGSISGVVNLIFLPGISQWSDEYRSAWGRRIPFLAVATPLTVTSVVLMGFAPEIAGVVHGRLIHPISSGVALSTVILILLSSCIVAFQYLNMVLVNAYNWLIRDVVPQVVMARFLSWFRIVSTLSAGLFNWFVFPYIIDYRKEICAGIGLFYLVAFLLMCLKVKEGEYPDPPIQADKPNVFRAYIAYFKKCLSVPIYRNYFFVIMVMGVAVCSGPFFLLFQSNTLGLSMKDLGEMATLTGVIGLAAYLPMGWVCDKFSPIRVVSVALPAMCVLAILSFFFINDKYTLFLFAVIGAPFAVGWGLGSSAMTMELFPTAKFGQFFAATNIFGTGISILGNFLIGILMDVTHSNYRLAYLWSAVVGLGLIPLFFVYRDWKRYGGPDNYVAPLPPE